jgi:hypothetical protein
VSRLAPDFADFRFLGQAATLFDALYAPPPRRGVIVVTRHDFDAAIRRSNVRAQTLWPPTRLAVRAAIIELSPIAPSGCPQPDLRKSEGMRQCDRDHCPDSGVGLNAASSKSGPIQHFGIALQRRSHML